MEHHSNLLPWQMAARRTGATLKYLECEPDGSFTEEKICDAVTPHTKLAALTLVSNVLGRATPAEKLIGMVHENGGVVLADAAQAAPHMPIDVTALDVDFLAFSGHKLMAPMGIGVLYGKQELLEEMPPFLTGGEMIDRVTREGAVFAELPHKFEAGTVNAGGAVALAARDRLSGIHRLERNHGARGDAYRPAACRNEKNSGRAYSGKRGRKGALRNCELYRG